MSQRLEPSEQARVIAQLADNIEEPYVHREAASRIAALDTALNLARDAIARQPAC
jgi:hypothetical protein